MTVTITVRDNCLDCPGYTYDSVRDGHECSMPLPTLLVTIRWDAPDYDDGERVVPPAGCPLREHESILIEMGTRT